MTERGRVAELRPSCRRAAAELRGKRRGARGARFRVRWIIAPDRRRGDNEPLMKYPLVLVCLAALAGGCQDNITTVFPPGLEPLEDNKAPSPADGSETLVMIEGGGDLKWVHGRAYILAPPAAVWAATQDPEPVVAACATTSHSVMVGVEAQYEYGFMVHYSVDNIVTVEWDEAWRYGTITGTPDAPELAVIRYQKVFGSEYISTLEGSIILYATADPAVTEVAYIERLDALGGDHGNIRSSMEQRFANMRALAHGEPLPGCL